MSLKLGHISDIHIFAMNQFGVRRFLNKRLVGGANLAFKRGKSHSSTSVDIAIQRIHELGCEHLAVSGDLTNLALDEEFVAAREIPSCLAAAVIEGAPATSRKMTNLGRIERSVETSADESLLSSLGRGGCVLSFMA